MTEPEEEAVDWSLIARDPQVFFGLESGYSRKDLKRSYNRLIRIYKPERAPEEFQRIRGAFELLDNSLRYGEQSQPKTSVNMFDWTTAATAGASPSPSATGPRSTAQGRTGAASQPAHEALLAQIEKSSVRATYAELSKREQRSPFDYFALAVLSDTLQDDPLTFFKWLLSGLKLYPGERGLTSTLYASLRGPLADDVVPRLLVAVARTVRTDRFYSLTEPLWDRILKNRPFEEFFKLLRKCESELQDYRVEGQVAFYLHILKAAVWMAPPEWVDEKMLFIDENQPEVFYGGDFELELLGALRDYIQSRDEFLNGNSLRAQMDQAVRDFCLLSDSQSEHSFVECQIRIASSGEEVLKAFPFSLHPSDDSMQILWEWISLDVGGRLPDQVDEVDSYGNHSQAIRKRSQRVRGFLRSIEARTDASGIGRIWNFFAWIMGTLIIGGIYPAIVLPLWLIPSGLIDQPSAGVVSLLVALVVGIGLGFILQKKWLPEVWGNICLKFAACCYTRIWRREVQQYLRRSKLSVYEFLIAVEASADVEKMPASTWLMHLTQRDAAQQLFVSAQRYLA